MKVTRNLPQQLIVEDRPWLVSLLLVGIALVFAGAALATLSSGEPIIAFFLGLGAFMGVLALFLFTRRVQIIFDRPSDSVTIRRRSMRGTTEVKHKLSNLGEAVVETMSGDGADTYRVSLVLTDGMSAGRHPVTGYYVSGKSAPRLAQEINAWLNAAKVDSAATGA